MNRFERTQKKHLSKKHYEALGIGIILLVGIGLVVAVWFSTIDAIGNHVCTTASPQLSQQLRCGVK